MQSNDRVVKLEDFNYSDGNNNYSANSVFTTEDFDLHSDFIQAALDQYDLVIIPYYELSDTRKIRPSKTINICDGKSLIGHRGDIFDSEWRRVVNVPKIFPSYIGDTKRTSAVFNLKGTGSIRGFEINCDNDYLSTEQNKMTVIRLDKSGSRQPVGTLLSNLYINQAYCGVVMPDSRLVNAGRVSIENCLFESIKFKGVSLYAPNTKSTALDLVWLRNVKVFNPGGTEKDTTAYEFGAIDGVNCYQVYCVGVTNGMILKDQDNESHGTWIMMTYSEIKAKQVGLILDGRCLALVSESQISGDYQGIISKNKGYPNLFLYECKIAGQQNNNTNDGMVIRKMMSGSCSESPIWGGVEISSTASERMIYMHKDPHLEQPSAFLPEVRQPFLSDMKLLDLPGPFEIEINNIKMAVNSANEAFYYEDEGIRHHFHNLLLKKAINEKEKYGFSTLRLPDVGVCELSETHEINFNLIGQQGSVWGAEYYYTGTCVIKPTVNDLTIFKLKESPIIEGIYFDCSGKRGVIPIKIADDSSVSIYNIKTNQANFGVYFSGEKFKSIHLKNVFFESNHTTAVHIETSNSVISDNVLLDRVHAWKQEGEEHHPAYKIHGSILKVRFENVGSVSHKIGFSLVNYSEIEKSPAWELINTVADQADTAGLKVDGNTALNIYSSCFWSGSIGVEVGKKDQENEVELKIFASSAKGNKGGGLYVNYAGSIFLSSCQLRCDWDKDYHPITIINLKKIQSFHKIQYCFLNKSRDGNIFIQDLTGKIQKQGNKEKKVPHYEISNV